AAFLDLADALVDEVFLDRLAVDRLDDLGGLFLAGRHDALEDVLGVGVAGEHALEVQDGQAAQAAHLDRQARTHHAVHGPGDDRQLVAVATEIPGDVDLVGIDRQGTRHQRDVIEAICRPGLAPASDPHPHARSPFWLAPFPARSPNIGIAAPPPTRFSAVYRP